MATIKPVLRKKPNKHYQFPIAIRITKNRKSSYIFLGQYIEEKYWDLKNQRVKQSHPNSARLNYLILTKMASCNEKLLEMESSKNAKSLKKIKEIIVSNPRMDFSTVADIYLNNILSRKKSNQYITDRNRIEQFKKFCSNKPGIS